MHPALIDPRINSLTPMLASRESLPFDSPDWIFELKWGGVRALAFIEDGRVTLRGQNRRDITRVYPELQGLAAQVEGRSAVLDGEIVGLGPRGYPRIELLRPRLNGLLGEARSPAGAATAPLQPGVMWGPPRADLSYEVTDMLAFEGVLLTDRPLAQRKNLLHARFLPTPQAQVTPFVEQDGMAFFEAVSDLGLEGMIGKERHSRYLPGSLTDQWLEVPALGTGDFVIGGYTFGGGARKTPFETLLLGAYRGEQLVYAGRATASLSNPEGWRTVGLLEELHTSGCPFIDPPRTDRLTFWCRPDIVCQVRTGERTASGELRFALFVCLRPDLPPAGCLWQQPSGAR